MFTTLYLKHCHCRQNILSEKKLERILRSGALEEVHDPTCWCSKAYFVQKTGSPETDPSVRLVTNLKTANKMVDKVDYSMDGPSHS